ncbi:hydrogenase/urease maturation nickel metallochaperone HypA [Vibrio ulleungensis]|uniref:Hydrogenase maturation nickel metallochaperone HypA n=1 Tax=Vibrio ulleungensis TaxID=2807619 RepID=A0ABS2HD13_9VIBR|nr:hydrogenase maturation nickel metallochaperone HypA [Vibrio ulleungensis]
MSQNQRLTPNAKSLRQWICEANHNTLTQTGLCHHCGESFEILKHRSICPSCEQNKWGLLSGKEFMVKEIIAH